MSFHLISHKNWAGRMLFFPVSFPRLAEAPIPMWRFVELYCLWGQLIQQQTFGRAKKKHRAHPKKGTKKPEKKPSDASAKKREGLWRLFLQKGGDGKPGGNEISAMVGNGFLWSAKSLNSLRSATSKAFCTITVPPLEKAKAEAASDLEVWTKQSVFQTKQSLTRPAKWHSKL